MSSDRLSGTVRLGVLHDGIEAAATTVLADFMTTHPESRIEVVVDTSQALIDAMEAGKLDQAIAFQVNTRLPRDTLGLVPMRWIGIRQRSLIDVRPLPLVMLLDVSCSMQVDERYKLAYMIADRLSDFLAKARKDANRIRNHSAS